MTVHGDPRQDRLIRLRQFQPDEWDRDKSDQRRLLAGGFLTGLVCLVALIRWLFF